MKKQLLIIFYVIFAILNLYCNELKFIVTKNVTKENSLEEKKSIFYKGDKLIEYPDFGFGMDFFEPISFHIRLINPSNSIKYIFTSDEVDLINNKNSMNKNFSKDFWIPEYYYEQINRANRTDVVLSKESYWKKWQNRTEDDDFNWLEDFAIQRFYFGDFFFSVIHIESQWSNTDFVGILEECSSTTIIYNVLKMYNCYRSYKEYDYYAHPNFISLYEREVPFKVFFIIDGDYMKMYIDEVSEKKLFQTLVRTTPEACSQIENWIKGKSNDLSKVVMPKKGDNSTNNIITENLYSIVFVNKTMSVSENLKLRSGEATSTQVLTVMAAGTKVKILELGKQETIDGITSNWVKVEVQAGAKDRDGKMIKAGTVGWCYGGYLK